MTGVQTCALPICDFKRITHPRDHAFENRFQTFPSDNVVWDEDSELYSIDEEGDGQMDYSFEKPDFKVFHFISNLVLRWEYVPGSVFYIVWSQNRSDNTHSARFDLEDDMHSLFRVYPHNIFMVKFSYRIQYHHLRKVF